MQTAHAPLTGAESPLPSARWQMVGILLVGGIAAWVPPFVTVVPHDYLEFLLPWYQHIRAAGQLGAFAHPFSNYTPPYLYLVAISTLPDLPPLFAIKLLSTLGSLWTAYATYRLLTVARAPQAFEGSLAVLLLPTVTLNGPVLAQADMFWVAPCLLAIASCYRGNAASAAFWAGVGFAFKAQAIFIAPFVIAMLILMRARWWHWLIPALVYAAATLPAWVAGWPAIDLLTIYIRQAQYIPPDGVRYVSTASNWWALFAYLDHSHAVQTFWIGFAAAIVASLFYIRRLTTRGSNLLLGAATSSTMLPFLLPGMHERFYALAELAVFCLAWTCRSRRTVIAALLMQMQLLLAYFGWILRRPELAIVGAALVTGVLWLLVGELTAPAQDGEASERSHRSILRNDWSEASNDRIHLPYRKRARGKAQISLEPRAHV